MTGDERILSVVIPCYNERATIREILGRVSAQRIVGEVIVVDDGSTDGSRPLLGEIQASWPATAPPLRVLLQTANRGKAAALREGFRRARGPLTLVQDADLEYDPSDYPRLARPVLDGEADVVYGSRFAVFPRPIPEFWHFFGNRLLTMLSNLMTGLDLTDMETCYKLFRTELLRDIPLRSEGFGFEPEITAKIARRRCRIREVPISYRGRSRSEGKKIGWRDGIQAAWLILEHALVDDPR